MEAAQLASQFREKGFKTLKLKVGTKLKGDIKVLQAIGALVGNVYRLYENISYNFI